MCRFQKAFVVSNPNLPDNPIVWTSEAFLSMTGYDRDQVIGRNCRFLQGPRTDPKQVAIIREAVTREHEASVTILNYRKDGTTFWNRFSSEPWAAGVRSADRGRYLACRVE